MMDWFSIFLEFFREALKMVSEVFVSVKVRGPVKNKKEPVENKKCAMGADREEIFRASDGK
jgi:hypothetical protein